MKTYSISIVDQAHESLREIVQYKKEYDLPSSILFFDGFYEDIKKLETNPLRGEILTANIRRRIYNNHIIPYWVDEEKLTVFILDIFDPMQHSKAIKYL